MPGPSTSAYPRQLTVAELSEMLEHLHPDDVLVPSSEALHVWREGGWACRVDFIYNVRAITSGNGATNRTVLFQLPPRS